MVITIINLLKVKEGKMNEVVEILKKITPKLRQFEPWLIEFIPYTGKLEKNKNLLILYEKYENIKADKEFFKLWLKETKKLGFSRLLEAESDTKICDEIIWKEIDS